MRNAFGIIASLLLAASAISGCVGSGSDKSQGEQIEGTIVDGFVLNGTAGGIIGRLLDDIGVPVPTAHITLANTEFSSFSNRTGSFRLLNVTPGQHTMRVEHPDYKPAERLVEVLPSKVIEVSLTLLPRVDVGAGYRPHLHDYWAGETEKVVIDKSFEWQEPYQCNGAFRETFCRYYDTTTQLVASPCVWQPSEVYFNNRQIWFNDPTQTVYPGTKRIEVKATWGDQDYQGTELAMAWRNPTSPLFEQGPYFKRGETFTIDVAANQSDSGHQTYTLWEFWLCLADSGTQDIPQMPFLGSVKIEMRIVRGYDVVAEPPHPNFWANGPERTVISPTQKGVEKRFAANSYSLARTSFGSGDAFAVKPLADHIVPPGTKELAVRLEWTYSLAANNPAWSLTYRSADTNPLSTKDPAALTKATPAEKGTGFRTYLIPVKPVMTDAFYQRVSSWLFYLSYEGGEADWHWLNQCGCDISVKLTVTAIKDPAYDTGRGE